MAVKAVTWLVIALVHGTVTILLPGLLLYADLEPRPAGVGVLRLLGVVPVAVGVLVLTASVWNLVTAGKGTPAPFDPPQALVVGGLYRFVRNPMYIGDLLVLWGESLLFGSPLLLAYSLLILAVCHLFVVLYEEPALRRTFGGAYARYSDAVPRWIPAVPGS
jgi:protein-S-isoprenylcysteine O-methyltransferase Ste14